MRTMSQHEGQLVHAFFEPMYLVNAGKTRLTAGDDMYQAGDGGEHVLGLRGNDQIFGGDGNDILQGGAGNDTLYGDTGNDRSSDTLYGGEGNDFLGGGAYGDNLFGGNGNDQLAGGNGRDILEGGAGLTKLPAEWAPMETQTANAISLSIRRHPTVSATP